MYLSSHASTKACHQGTIFDMASQLSIYNCCMVLIKATICVILMQRKHVLLDSINLSMNTGGSINIIS